MALSAAAAYTWPNTQTDYLEKLLYEQITNLGAIAGLPSGVASCAKTAVDFPGPTVDRTNSAEWLRTAFHDMATADVVAGTGGIDASIGFEFADRPENVGRAFIESIGFFINHMNIGASMADLIALATVITVGSCSNWQHHYPLSGWPGGRAGTWTCRSTTAARRSRDSHCGVRTSGLQRNRNDSSRSLWSFNRRRPRKRFSGYSTNHPGPGTFQLYPAIILIACHLSWAYQIEE